MQKNSKTIKPNSNAQSYQIGYSILLVNILLFLISSISSISYPIYLLLGVSFAFYLYLFLKPSIKKNTYSLNIIAVTFLLSALFYQLSIYPDQYYILGIILIIISAFNIPKIKKRITLIISLTSIVISFLITIYHGIILETYQYYLVFYISSICLIIITRYHFLSSVNKSNFKEDIDFLQMLENINEGVVFSDLDGKCLKVNKRWAEMTGYTEEELISHDNIHQLLLYNEGLEMIKSKIEERKKGEKGSYELRLRTKQNKDIWALTIGTPLYTTNGKIIGSMGIMTDITEIKKMNQKLKQANKELNLKNIELDRFAAVISHDLRSPLKTILSFSQLLEKRNKDLFNKDSQEYLNFIKSGCLKMNTYIEGLLHVARFGNNTKEKRDVNLSKLIDDICLLLNLKIDITYKNLPQIHGNKTQIHQLFQNLIENSIKYKNPEEVLRISISHIKENGKTVFYFKDNGIGIESKYHGKIFDPFRQVDISKDGVGIGLFTCQKVMNNHNGSINIDSSLGNGTTFILEFGENF